MAGFFRVWRFFASLQAAPAAHTGRLRCLGLLQPSAGWEDSGCSGGVASSLYDKQSPRHLPRAPPRRAPCAPFRALARTWARFAPRRPEGTSSCTKQGIKREAGRPCSCHPGFCILMCQTQRPTTTAHFGLSPPMIRIVRTAAGASRHARVASKLHLRGDRCDGMGCS